MLDLDDALDHLAPEVDLTASRELFDRRRSGGNRAPGAQRRRGRLALAAAAAVVLVGIGAVLAIDRDGTTTLEVTDPGEVDGDVGTVVTTISAAPTSTVPEAERFGTVALPALGTTGSGLLDDGMPVWVVHHPDGSVSVLPAIVYDGYVNPTSVEQQPTVDQLSGTLRVVLAYGNRGFRSKDLAWDPWGRTVNGQRLEDLDGYGGVVVGDRVQVIHTGFDPIPGEPQGPAVDDPAGGDQPMLPDPLPSTPDQVGAIATATPGWHRITDRVHLYGTGDAFRLCSAPAGVETYSIGALAGCAGPVAGGVMGPAGWMMDATGDPFLVRVGESGQVEAVALYVLSGGSWAAPSPP